MPFSMLPGGGDVVIIGQKALREKLSSDVMAQIASRWCWDGAYSSFCGRA